MATYKGLPLFNMDLIEGVEGIRIISLVDFPAIERDFIKFGKETEIKFSVNEEKHIVSGPVLIPDQKIFRRDAEGAYYIQFSADAIKRIAEKFFMDHNSTNVNLQHEFEVGDCVYFESYFIDKARGIVPAEFEDLPDGTWMVSCKINNPAVWELVKDGTLRGFSVEGKLQPYEDKNEAIDTIEGLLKYIKGNF